MTDLPNRVSKEQLHLIVFIIVVTMENITLRKFRLLAPDASGRLLLKRLLPRYLETR